MTPRAVGREGRATKRQWTADEREARSQKMRAAWADGRFADRKPLRHARAWSRAEDAILAELAGTMPIAELTAELSRRSGMERTETAVRVRATRTGVSLWPGGFGLGDIERNFRLDHRAIVRCWLEPGILHGRRWAGRGPFDGWWIEPAEVERFIRECAWAYDWERIPAGRWRSLAEVAHKADPWLHYDQVMAYVGLSKTNLDKWRRRGLVPHRIRPKSGPGGYVMVRAHDLVGIKASIEAAQAEARERSLAKILEWSRTAERDERGRTLPRWRAA